MNTTAKHAFTIKKPISGFRESIHHRRDPVHEPVHIGVVSSSLGVVSMSRGLAVSHMLRFGLVRVDGRGLFDIICHAMVLRRSSGRNRR
eukprot:493225-Pyramimonas_sp.AAC.1